MNKLLNNIRFLKDGELVKGKLAFNEKIIGFYEEHEKVDVEFSKELDGKGNIILPGGIDSHVHFNTPGFENHETFENGSRGAVKGGITTIIDMPCTSLPPVVGKAEFENKLSKVKDQAYCDFAFHGGISGNLFEEEGFDIFERVRELKKCGITAIKIYTVSGMDTFKELNNLQMLETFKAASFYDIPVMIHAEDSSIVRGLQKKFEKEGKSYMEYFNSRPVEGELIAINDVAYFAQLTEATVHIVHISSMEGVELVRSWSDKGVSITCETCPHYLDYNYKDFEKFGSFLKTAPVVKTEKDSEEMWNQLREGLISFITTDHAPCNGETEKNTGDFFADYGGIPSVEILYPFILSEAYLKKHFPLEETIKFVTENPAKLFGMYPQKGSLKTGADSDFILFDEKNKFVVNSKNFESMGKYSPFDGREFSGKIIDVFISGEKVVDNGIICKQKGSLIRREK